MSRSQSHKETKSSPRHQIELKTSSLPRSVSSASSNKAVDKRDYIDALGYTPAARRTQSVSQLGSRDMTLSISPTKPLTLQNSEPERATIRKSLELIPQSQKLAQKGGLLSPEPLSKKNRHKSEGELRSIKRNKNVEVSYMKEKELELQIETFFSPLETSQSSTCLNKGQEQFVPYKKPESLASSYRNNYKKLVRSHEDMLKEELSKDISISGKPEPNAQILNSSVNSKPEVLNNNNNVTEIVKKETVEAVSVSRDRHLKPKDLQTQQQESTIVVGNKPIHKPRGVTFAEYGKFCEDFEEFQSEQDEEKTERRTSSPAPELDDSFCLDDDPADVFDQLEQASPSSTMSAAAIEAAAFRPSCIPDPTGAEERGFMKAEIDDLLLNIDSPSRERSKKAKYVQSSDSEDDDNTSICSLEKFATQMEEKQDIIVHQSTRPPVSFRVHNTEIFRPSVVEPILEEDSKMMEDESFDETSNLETVNEVIEATAKTPSIPQDMSYSVNRPLVIKDSPKKDQKSTVSKETNVDDIFSDKNENSIEESATDKLNDNIPQNKTNKTNGNLIDEKNINNVLLDDNANQPLNGSFDDELDTYVGIISDIPGSPRKIRPHSSKHGVTKTHDQNGIENKSLTQNNETLSSIVIDKDLNSSGSDLDSFLVLMASDGDGLDTNRNIDKRVKVNSDGADSMSDSSLIARRDNNSSSSQVNQGYLETDIDSIILEDETNSDSVANGDVNKPLDKKISASEPSSQKHSSIACTHSTESSQFKRPVQNRGELHAKNVNINQNNINPYEEAAHLHDEDDGKNFWVTETNWEAIMEVFWSNVCKYYELID